jgi:spermidine synthase
MSSQPRPRSFLTTVLLLFAFFSGFSALVYETVWQLMLCRTFGTTTVSVTIIIASFMCGFFLGSVVLGRKADRYVRPMRVYAALELGIALSAYAFPCVLRAISGLFIWISAAAGPLSWQASVARFSLVFLALMVPSTLMGGTLPVLAAVIARDRSGRSRNLGLLYGTNTLGAAAGCFAAGFFLVRFFGMRAAVLTAAAINAVLAAAAFGSGRYFALGGMSSVPGQGRATRRAVAIVAPARPLSPVILVAAAAMTGAAALACEVLWTRCLVIFLQSSVYAFPTMLTTFLLGSAAGSAIFARAAKFATGKPVAATLLPVALGIAVVATIPMFGVLDKVMYALWISMGSGFVPYTVIGFVASALILLPPTLLMGMVFPLIAALYTGHSGRPGKGMGVCYGANTLGAVAGSVVVTWLLIPLLGITHALLLCGALYFTTGIMIAMEGPQVRAGNILRTAFAVFPVASALIGGFFLVRMPLWGKSLNFHSWQESMEIIYYKEGAGATVVAGRQPHDMYTGERYLRLCVDGVNVAGTSPMLRITQKLQGHLPLMLFRARTGKNARAVFTVGLASGETCRCLALHDIERVDCAELVPEETGALHLFEDINRGVIDNSKLRVLFTDARSYLLCTADKYDVIASDAVHPDVSLYTYTKEYFEICRDRLSPDGIFSTWVPLYNMSERHFGAMIRTLHEVFPHVQVWYSPQYRNKHIMLMGTMAPLRMDYRVFCEEFDRPGVGESLAEIAIDYPAFLMNCLVSDEATAGGLLDTVPVNTDDRPVLQYEIPLQKRSGSITVAGNLGAYCRRFPDMSGYLSAVPDSSDIVVLGAYAAAARHLVRGNEAFYAGKLSRMVNEFDSAWTAVPECAAIEEIRRTGRFTYLYEYAEMKASKGDRAAFGALRSAVELIPQSPTARNRLGLLYLSADSLAQALACFDTVLKTYPDLTPALYNRAVTLQKLGDIEGSLADLEALRCLAPDLKKADRLRSRIRARGRR